MQEKQFKRLEIYWIWVLLMEWSLLKREQMLLILPLEARLLIDGDYEWDAVTEEVREALVDAFSFSERAFSQPVTSAEVLNIIHDVEGVIAVDLEKLHLVDGIGKPVGKPLSTILSAQAAALNTEEENSADRFLPAELLLINESGITFSEMED